MRNKQLKFVVLMLVILAIGSILLAACTRPGSTIITNTGSTPAGGGEPNTVHMGDSNFLQSTVTIAKGVTLKLVDDSSVQHVLQNGMWDSSGNAQNLTEPNAPTVNNLTVSGNSTVSIGPFNTAGTFHIYCTIHPGMNLTITVQ